MYLQICVLLLIKKLSIIYCASFHKPDPQRGFGVITGKSDCTHISVDPKQVTHLNS